MDGLEPSTSITVSSSESAGPLLSARRQLVAPTITATIRFQGASIIFFLYLVFSLLRKCVLAGISATTLIQLVLCICAMTWLGIPYLIAGIWAVKQKLFTSYAALSLSAVLLFFVSSMGLVVAWLLPPLTGDQQLRCAGLGSTLCFDLTCWTLIAWCLGQNVSRWIKGQLAAPLCSLEKSLYPRGYIRLVGDGGKLDLVPKPLVQNGDVVVVRPGETLWCDGIAEVSKQIRCPEQFTDRGRNQSEYIISVVAVPLYLNSLRLK